MDNNFSAASWKKEILFICSRILTISVGLFLISLVLILFSEILKPRNSRIHLIRDLTTLWGFLLVFVGIVVFLFYSSYSFGFDAIWTPQLQGEIQRDERKRQISGWSRAITGGFVLIVGIILLYFTINVFWLR